MKILVAILSIVPTLAWAECTNVGIGLMNCDGQRGLQLGNQTWVPAPGGGLEPYAPQRIYAPPTAYDVASLNNPQFDQPKEVYHDDPNMGPGIYYHDQP
jgi:hypothetical protein